MSMNVQRVARIVAAGLALMTATHLEAVIHGGGSAHGGSGIGGGSGFHGSVGTSTRSAGYAGNANAGRVSHPTPSMGVQASGRPYLNGSHFSAYPRPGILTARNTVRSSARAAYGTQDREWRHPYRPPYRPYGPVIGYGFSPHLGWGEFGYLGWGDYGYGDDFAYDDTPYDPSTSPYYANPNYSGQDYPAPDPAQQNYPDAAYSAPYGYGAPPTGYGAQPYGSRPYGAADGYPRSPYQPYTGSASTAHSKPLPPQEAVTLVFKDGRPEQQIHNYILSRTTLSVLDGQRQVIQVRELDLAATVKVNREAGVDFKLPVTAQ